jgi:hypothetical protein
MPKLALDRDAHFIENAYTLAHLSEAAYADDPESDTSFRRTIFVESATAPITFSDPGTDTQGFVCSNDEHLVVAFRGTQPAELRDWLTNLTFGMVKEEGLGGRVHEGFNNGLNAAWDDVIAAINKLKLGEKTFWLTGHSLGGALATLFARWLVDKQRPFCVCTFGQPRVGDQSFARNYRRRLFRFVNNRDIVPTVPPRFIPGNWFPPAFYTHVGELQFFDKSGDLLVTATSGELGVFPELVTALGPLGDGEAEARALMLGGLEDHKIRNYIRCLKQNLP